MGFCPVCGNKTRLQIRETLCRYGQGSAAYWKWQGQCNQLKRRYTFSCSPLDITKRHVFIHAVLPGVSIRPSPFKEPFLTNVASGRKCVCKVNTEKESDAVITGWWQCSICRRRQKINVKIIFEPFLTAAAVPRSRTQSHDMPGQILPYTMGRQCLPAAR